MISKPFKTNLGKDAVYNFINSMIEESKYYNKVMKKHFNKELVMTKKEIEDFKNSTKCWICDNDYIDTNDVNTILMLNKKIIVISPENIKALQIETVISILNKITKFLSHFTT